MSITRMRGLSLLGVLGVLLCTTLGAVLPSHVLAGGEAQALVQQGGQTGVAPRIVDPLAPTLGIVVYSAAADGLRFMDAHKVTVGDTLRVCYTVPAAGPITITKYVMAGTDRVILSGYDDGTGGCVDDTVAEPAGPACYRITNAYSSQQPVPGTQVCQTVVEVTPIPLSQTSH